MKRKSANPGRTITAPILERYPHNPILKPVPQHFWESKAVFNPAALYLGGKVHLLYRAIGDNDVSVLGYAASSDGFTIDERLDYPAYVPREPFEGVQPHTRYSAYKYTSPYESGGGGLGGCEDPRLTQIDDTIYLTYVAYNGYSHPRVALSSINVNDFLNKNWKWKRPVLISPPDIVDKNACILPELLNGKYVIFHRIFPHILIDFRDNLEFDGETQWLEGQYLIPTKDYSWDSRKVAAGPPPIKTPKGWLLIYHAIDDRDDLRYKIGAMLLDLKEPTKVIARTSQPILEPLADYENDGLKYGVVYPCGAAVINNRLLVYYGGADMVVCVASANLTDFLNRLDYQIEKNQISHPLNPRADIYITTEEDIQGYCLKCKKKQHIMNPVHTILSNHTHAVSGLCPQCGKHIVTMGRH
jgi:predicted GH43/DUF377 family glycosyl hydrolase